MKSNRNNSSYQYLDILSGIFVAVLLASNIASTKIVTLAGLSFDGGTLLFPLAYIFGDILTEVYGYGRSRRVIWLGFFSLSLMTLILTLVGLLPAPPDWPHQQA
ncbi:MAG: VUT family protein, partial [Pseudomonadota bacterium]